MDCGSLSETAFSRLAAHALELGRCGPAASWAEGRAPSIGRFTQPDTICPDVYDPQSLNRYSYVRNNPAGSTDPTGNCDPDQCSFKRDPGGSWYAQDMSYAAAQSASEQGPNHSGSPDDRGGGPAKPPAPTDAKVGAQLAQPIKAASVADACRLGAADEPWELDPVDYFSLDVWLLRIRYQMSAFGNYGPANSPVTFSSNSLSILSPDGTYVLSRGATLAQRQLMFSVSTESGNTVAVHQEYGLSIANPNSVTISGGAVDIVTGPLGSGGTIKQAIRSTVSLELRPNNVIYAVAPVLAFKMLVSQPPGWTVQEAPN